MFPKEKLFTATEPLEAVPFLVLYGKYKNEVGMLVSLDETGFILDTGEKNIKVTFEDGLIYMDYPCILTDRSGVLSPEDPTFLNAQMKMSINRIIKQLTVQFAIKTEDEKERMEHLIDKKEKLDKNISTKFDKLKRLFSKKS